MNYFRLHIHICFVFCLLVYRFVLFIRERDYKCELAKGLVT